MQLDGSREARSGKHGYTAEDRDGVGRGEEGFLAEEYPGQNPLRGESERERERRARFVWTWPRPTAEALGRSGEGSASDQRICEEIGERVLRAEPDLRHVVVHVLDGHVWLEGRVATLDDEHVLRGLASTVQGVTDVESSVEVQRS